jgi:ribosomal protein S18 acetylase RimI-like enzyme
LRLRALCEAPAAFGSTHERESAWSEDDWKARTAALAPFVVDDEGSGPVGSAGLVFDEPGAPHVVAVWVAPEARRRGVAKVLLDAVARSARAGGHRALRLHVARDDSPARALYLRLGFVDTGRTFALERDPNVLELEMELWLD